MITIGTPISREKAYILDKFLDYYKNYKIIFCTEDIDFASELRVKCGDNVRVVCFLQKKEKYYKLTNITRARERIREVFLNTNSDYLLFIDSDILVNPSSLPNGDVVYNSYLVHSGHLCNNGLGICLISRKVLKQIKFRSYIYEPLIEYDFFIDECLYFEMDALSKGFKIKHGCSTSTHYSNEMQYKELNQSTGIRISYKERLLLHHHVLRKFVSLFVNTPLMLWISWIQFKLHTKHLHKLS
jgi:hypothetical protein